MDIDDDYELIDDLSLGDEDYLRLLEQEETHYINSQLPQADIPMTQERPANLMEDIEEPEFVGLVTNANVAYETEVTQEIVDDFNFDLQRQGYRTETGTIVRDGVITELNKLKKERTLKDFKIESLELELARVKSLLKREDVSMQDSSDGNSLESRIFPNIGDFRVKRLDPEGSVSSRYNRPIKRAMRSRSVTPAPIMQLPKFASPIPPPRPPAPPQRHDLQTTVVEPVVIDYKKIERQNKLLGVLLGDSFLKWRRNSHIQLRTDLTKNQLLELCQIESKNLLPTKQCSPDSRKRLELISADFGEIMLNYQSNDILPKLLNSFRLCLTFALKENQHGIVIYILSKVKALTDLFDEAIHLLYKELNHMDTISTLFFTVISLKLFHADINPNVPTGLANQLPKVTELTLAELKTVTDDYSTKPDTILKIVKDRVKPNAAKKGTLCVLEIILNISKRLKQPLFAWLLNDDAFTGLLSRAIPYNIISNVLSVIETYPEESFLSAFKDVKEVRLFKNMTELLKSPPSNTSFDDHFRLRDRIIKILQKVSKMEFPLEIKKKLYNQTAPVLSDCISKELSEPASHPYVLSIDKREKIILAMVSLLALLVQYSSNESDDIYPRSTLHRFVCIVYDSLDYDGDRPMIQQTKEQLENIKIYLSQ